MVNGRFFCLVLSGIRTTCQFNTKIFYPDRKQPPLWSSDPLENYGFDADQVSFFADSVAVTLAEDGASYTIKSAVNEASIVNLTVKRTAPGFQVGKDGTTYFGTDRDHPWGRMRHAFWPRCTVEGSIITKEGEVDFKGRAFFAHALQGMKPHHAGRAFVDGTQTDVYLILTLMGTQLPSGILLIFNHQPTRPS